MLPAWNNPHSVTRFKSNTLEPSTEGTTLVAAVASNRRGVGYDIDPAYVELARTRLTDLEQPTSRPIPTSG